jgi:hypothetical protein
MVHWPYVSGFLEICWRISKEPQEWSPVMGGLPWDGLCAQLLTLIDKFSGACDKLAPCKQGLVVCGVHNSFLKPLKSFTAFTVYKRNINVEYA